MSEEKFYELERLHDKIYEETQEYGRTQFVSRIVDLQQENQQLKQWDKNKDTRNSRQRVANAKLLKENQQLCNEIDIWNDKYNAVDRDRKKYKSVLDEIREYSLDLHLYDNESLEFKISNDLLQILDKVKE